MYLHPTTAARQIGWLVGWLVGCSTVVCVACVYIAAVMSLSSQMKTLTREGAAVASKRCHTRIYTVLGLMMMMMMHISEGLHL